MRRSSAFRAGIAGILATVALVPAAGDEGRAAIPGIASSGLISAQASDVEATRVRKNVKALSAQERLDFVEAVLALKSAPSPFDPSLSYYDQFVAWHLGLYPCGLGHQMMRAHAGPMFPPWHRMFVLTFENALREVSGKPITVPYWDWSDSSSTAVVFADDFMGGDGDPDAGFAVTSGPFRKGKWELRVHPVGLEWSPSATDHITRRFASFPGFARLPTPKDVAFILGRPAYDVAPYDALSDPNVSFRNALEGFWVKTGPVAIPAGTMVCGPDGVMTAASGPGAHNLVHAWVGGLLGVTPRGPKVGTMLLSTSPNDPVFFLHHANIDRLWAEWQQAHGIDSYEPASCPPLRIGCTKNLETDPMHPPFEATPEDVADVHALGYRYDTLDAAPDVATVDPAVAVRASDAFRCRIRSSGTV